MARFTHVLCPVDLSDSSAHALTHAAVVAGWSAADLTLQHVYVPLFVAVPGLPPPVDRVSPPELARVENEIRRFAKESGILPDTPIVVDVGRPAESIVARAVRDTCDLIVMGTHGSSGFRHLVLGSVTERVLRLAPCAVLTVPPRAQSAASLPYGRLLCAVDFSPSSLEALALATSLADAGDATITAVHAIEWPWHEPPPPTLGDSPSREERTLSEFRRYTTERATARLDDVVREVVGDRCAVTSVIVHGTPHVEVLRVAAAIHADLVVLGVHGRSAVDVAFFGSTANQVVRHAQSPVLTVRR